MIRNYSIDISLIAGSELKSRATVSKILDAVDMSHNKSIVFDFSNVKFATRSFLDEFYNTFLKNDNAVINVEIINLTENIASLLESVKSTQNKSKSHFVLTKKVLRFSTVSEVNKYLSTLSM